MRLFECTVFACTMLAGAVAGAAPAPGSPGSEPGRELDARWSGEFAVPEPDGTVWAAEVLGGDLVIGGGFRQVGTVVTPGLARWDGHSWHALGEGPGAPVRAILVEGASLTVACAPESAGAPATVRRWDGRSWSIVGGGLPGSAVGVLRWRGDLVVAGRFALPGTEGHRLLARLERGRWIPLGPEPPGYAMVEAVVAHGDHLVLAGHFGIAGESRGLLSLAAGATGFDTLAHRPPLVVRRAWAAGVHDGELVIAGDFRADDAGKVLPQALMAWNGSGWRILDVGTLSTVRAIRSSSAGLLVAGGDSRFGEDVVGRVVGGSWRELPRRPGTLVRAIVEWGSRVVVGGELQQLFLSARPDLLRRLAVHDGADWHAAAPKRAVATGLEREALAFLFAGDEAHVLAPYAGAWAGDGWGPRVSVHRWSGGRWEPSSEEAPPGGGTSLASYRGTLYLGTAFGLHRLDGARWQPVTGIGREIAALTVHEDRLIAAGRLRIGDGSRVSAVAAFDGARWSEIGDVAGTPDSSIRVTALLSDRGSLYLAGEFSGFRDLSARSIVRWDGHAWTGVGSGLPGAVRALAATTGGIAAAGDFRDPAGGSLHGAATWNGIRWEFLDGVPPGRHAIAADARWLFIGGDDRSPEARVEPLVAWDGSRLHALGSGIGDDPTPPRPPSHVAALAVHDGRLWVGGQFLRAGDVASWNVAAFRLDGLSKGAGRGLAGTRPAISIAPNPVRPGEPLDIVVPSLPGAHVAIYDLAGRRVADPEMAEADFGRRARWDGRDARGRAVPAGIYFVRLRSRDATAAVLRVVRLP